MGESQYRPAWRRKFLINPRFQLTFMGYTIGMAFAAILIFFGAIHYFFWKFAETGRELGLPPDHLFFRFISEQQYQMNLVFGATSVITFCVLLVVGLLLSHRVAGPLYRLHRHMNQVADGETLSEVTFRKKDYFPELANAYNRQLKILKSKNKSQVA